MQNIEEISQIEKPAEGFKNEAARQSTLKVLESLKDLEACMQMAVRSYVMPCQKKNGICDKKACENPSKKQCFPDGGA